MHTNGSVEPTVVSDGFLLSLALWCLFHTAMSILGWSPDRAFGHDLGREAVPLLALTKSTHWANKTAQTNQPVNLHDDQPFTPFLVRRTACCLDHGLGRSRTRQCRCRGGFDGIFVARRTTTRTPTRCGRCLSQADQVLPDR
jgi:hypothetical protein